MRSIFKMYMSRPTKKSISELATILQSRKCIKILWLNFSVVFSSIFKFLISFCPSIWTKNNHLNHDLFRCEFLIRFCAETVKFWSICKNIYCVKFTFCENHAKNCAKRENLIALHAQKFAKKLFARKLRKCWAKDMVISWWKLYPLPFL